MNMLLWGKDVSGPEHDATFEMLKDAGFEGVEVGIFDADLPKYKNLGRRLAELGLEPIGVTARGALDSPISPDAAVRARGLALTRAAVDACSALGATLLCGPLQAPAGAFSGAAPTAEERARSVESLREAADYAATRGVTLVIEYLNRFETYLVTCAAEAASLVREVDHPQCRMMFDTFHAHIEEKDLRAALRECGDVLVHVHASENDRSTPGAGQVDWDAVFAGLAEIGYEGWISIEAFGGPAAGIWRRIFTSEEQLARDGAAFIGARL
ncbi:MAG: sugar phosphate isomerase/epimerase family protein [Gaiellaceae bacterium]